MDKEPFLKVWWGKIFMQNMLYILQEEINDNMNIERRDMKCWGEKVRMRL